MISLDQFVEDNNDKFIDVDHAFGAQCWDLTALYCQEVIGTPIDPGYGLPTGPDGAARNVWEYFKDPLPQFFDKVQPPFQRGDIVVWGTGVGPDGHIAIFLEPTSAGFTSFDQNWPVGSPAHQQSHNNNSILGALRPKGEGMNTPAVNEGDIINMWRAGGLAGDPPQSYIDTWKNSDWKKFMYDLTSQGLWQQAHSGGGSSPTPLAPGVYRVG